MRRTWRVIIGAVVVASGTWFGGWLVPAAWGVLAGLAWPGDRPARTAALGASLGWLALLAGPVATGAPVGVLAARLAGAMQLPEAALVAATLLFPALLASSAAYLVAARQRPAADVARGSR